MLFRVGIGAVAFALAISAADLPPLPAPALHAVYLGQDGHDYCTSDCQLQPNDIEDLHLRLEGLPAKEEIRSASFSRAGGGAWSYSTLAQPTPHFRAALLRESRSAWADVFLEPTFEEPAFDLHIELEYASGRKAELDARCGQSDTNLFMPQVVLQARWIGQDGHDLTGPTADVGPDGFQDARIDLAGLSKRLEIQALRIEADNGDHWECGDNRDHLANAELAWDPQDTSKGSLFFSPVSDLRGRKLALTILYANGRHQRIELTAGTTDPALAMPGPREFTLDAALSRSLSVNWLGQEDVAGRGDIHLELNGLPKDGEVQAVAVSDSCGGFWEFCLPEAESAFYGPAEGGLRTLGESPTEREKFGLFAMAPYEGVHGSAVSRFNALALKFQRRTDRVAADLYLPPFRDEAGSRMMLRVLLRIGAGANQTAICALPGQPCDPYRRGSIPADSYVTARPGDALSDLIAHFGHVVLTDGRYRIKAPLVLNHPVTISGSHNAILEFSQPPDAPEWSEAIRISAANTTLEGFAIRFAGPVRWVAGFGNARVIGAVPRKPDASEHPDPLLNVVVRELDIESSPVEPLPEPGQEQSSIFTINFAAAGSGRIVGNSIHGGTTDVRNGPWEISDNTYRGTMPGTVAWDAFAAHYFHDLSVMRNHVAPVAPCGKTWRFLVLTQRGDHATVADNHVENIGMKDTDKLANPNAPEIMLTESYRLNYEGRPARISTDGWIAQIPLVMYGQIEPGSILSVLSGPFAGHYFRIAQPLSPTVLLLEQPLPEALRPGNYAISVAHGLTDLAWERNTIDARGGRSSLMVLAGNHWNARLEGNHLLGGAEGLRICGAGATEHPGLWGWSRTPMFDLMADENLCEDSRVSIQISGNDDAYAKTTGVRAYIAGAVKDNTIRWSDAFLRSFGAPVQPSSSGPLSVNINTLSNAAQLRLHGNRLETQAGISTEVRLADFSQVPGVVIDHLPASTGLYVGSPSIVIWTNGEYVASHDFFGPESTEHTEAATAVFRSGDRGATWQKVATLHGQFWSSLFINRGVLYLMGTDKQNGNVVIRRSHDGGTTWTTPTDDANGRLRADAQYHTAPTPVVEHDGRLWRAMEQRNPPTGWGANLRAGIFSAPVEANLLAATNWTASDFLPRNADGPDRQPDAWLEGNAVIAPDGSIVDVLRMDKPDLPEKAAIVEISADGRTAAFNPKTGVVDFPGGAKKFTIRFDPQSRLYWSLVNIIPPEIRTVEAPSAIRNTLALVCSTDLRKWTVRQAVLHHANPEKFAFQYVDWQFDGDDLIAVCRTAYDDGLGGAHNYHDANFLTFHRWKNFRDLRMVSSLPP
jgi:hypothetical protein